MSKLFKAVLIISAIIVLIFFFNLASSCKDISCIKMEGIYNFKVKKINQNDSEGYKAIYESSNKTLRTEIVNNLNQDDAEQIINARVTRLKGLFSDAPAPYPGMVSDKIVCDKKFVPSFYEKEINNNKISYFTGYLSSRMTFGTCTEDESVYKGLFILFYCPGQQKMYQMEFIGPKNEFGEDEYIRNLNSIRCN